MSRRNPDRGPWRTAGGRRRLTVLSQLLLAVAVCVLGYRYLAGWFQVHEARWVAGALNLLGVDSVSGVLPEHILIYHGRGEVLSAEITGSCTAVLSVLGLTALTLTVLRSRGFHALAGLATAIVGVVLLNDLRLGLSTLAGLWWGDRALVLFHDWIGTVWTFASTLVGFLLMVYVTLPAAERAEQNVAGHHTARRPSSWARPGLGYRIPEQDETAPRRRRTLTGLMHRYVLPRSVSARLADRREAGRIDYRIGHMPPDERIARVRALAADGLAAHTATLLAVATHEKDVRVLDVLADEVAARQWEPVINERVTAVRLWARGWLFARRTAATGQPAAEASAAGPDDVASTSAIPLARRRPRPPVPVPSVRPQQRTATPPSSFARARAVESPRREDLS